MATTSGASTYDSTMLILFCGSDYYVIDDYNKGDVYAGPTRITDTWPDLQDMQVSPGGTGTAKGTFASDLDAVYYEASSKRLVFFKGASCAIADYSSGSKPTWESGLITDYYQFSGTNPPTSFTADIDGAAVGRDSNSNVAHLLFLHKDGYYAAGTSTPPRKGSPVLLTYSDTQAQAGWPLPPQDDSTVAAEYVYPPGSQVWESTLFTTKNKNKNKNSQSVDDYTVMFYTSRQKNAAPNKLWPHFNGAPIDAAVRLDPSLGGCGNTGSGDPGSGDPGSGDPGSGDPGSGAPGSGTPGSGTGQSLCCELPMILQTICSMTALLNKVVDACYPPSSWPKHPYPTGCGNDGHKGKGCKCSNGQAGNGSQGTDSTSATAPKAGSGH
jgi:hypothetical protein